MFAGYKLKLEANSYSKYYELGESEFRAKKDDAKDRLARYIRNDVLLVDELENDWFPNDHYDVFLSHSHADEKLAIGFAVYLQEQFGVRVFIDSCVWGNVYDLLGELNKSYSFLEKKENKIVYDYQQVNLVASHAYMVLNVALHKMIDSTECLIFLNTPNSIKYGEEATGSPWIYSELFFSRMVAKKPRDYREDEIKHSFAELKSCYRVDLKHLNPLKQETILSLADDSTLHRKPHMFLDALYERTGVTSHAK